MAERRPFHQSFQLRSGLEAGGQAYNPPLLPYEKALIDAIGCTEEEYKTLVRHAMSRQRVRPAEYDHIPEINNELTTTAVLVINLVVGALLTTASVLLAPKPPSFESGDQKKITGKKLADQVGPSRYNQSTSFDNSPSLAELNSPIPIPFGLTGVGPDDLKTGGLVFVPALVWSRVYAYGTYQAFEGIYVAGESGVTKPDVGGILLGTSALNALGQRDFAVYWSSNQGSNRFVLQGANIAGKHVYGTEKTVDSGTVGRTVFSCPSGGNPFSDGFSMSYAPSGDTTFGVSTPIHNGTPYKFNWQVVSAPYSAFEDNSTVQTEFQAKRRKIAGTDADDLQNFPEAGMPGIGRAYSRHMGFIYTEEKDANGNPVAREFVNKDSTRQLQPGDKAVFEIYHSDTSYLNKEAADFPNTEVNLQDLINSAKEWRQRASDLLTIGSRWICGGLLMVVEARATTAERTHVTFKAVGNIGDVRLGVVGTKNTREALGGYDGGAYGDKHVGPGWWNLCSYNTATIRPVRRDVDTIEFGIRSQVWNRASGLCNFNTIPSPSRLLDLDRDDVNVETGRMDKYFTRYSCFGLFVRPVADQGKTQEGFKRINQVFCVQGNSPTFQFNYLRVRPLDAGNGTNKILYEYRFSPLPGTFLLKNLKDEHVIILQSTEGLPYHPSRQATIQGGEIYIKTGVTDGSYGEFGITTQGKRYKQDGQTPIKVSDLFISRELQSNPPKIIIQEANAERYVPTELSPGQIIGNDYRAFVGTSLNDKPVTSILAGHAWLTENLGMAKSAANRGKTKSVEIDKYKPGGGVDGTITVKLTATSSPSATGKFYKEANGGSTYEWVNPKFEVVRSTGSWKQGTLTQIVADTPASTNVFAAKSADEKQPYDKVYWELVVSAAEKVTSDGSVTEEEQPNNRRFEESTGVADVSYYSEIQKSCDSGPEHEVVFVNECLVNERTALYDGMSTVGFVVKSSGEINGIEQLRLCCSSGINVERLAYKWKGYTNYPSNNFADLVYYLLTSSTQGVGNIVPAELVDKDSLKTTADFLSAIKFCFDGVLEDSESLRGFLYETAPLQLCTFTIKNGKFGMMPALPYKSVTPQDDDRVRAIGINDDSPIAVDEIFTAGNIIEDTFQLQYIDLAQRSNIRAVVTWRVTKENDLPYQASALLYWADLDDSNATEQAFDLSDFCTNRKQALMTAKFLMSTRRRVTKTVSFKTSPDNLHVQPGSYIRVITEASVYDASTNGEIRDAGKLITVSHIEDGVYKALLYGSDTQEVIEAEIQIANNTIVGETPFDGYLFSLLTSKTDYSVYQIDSLNLEEDGLVSISAVEVPTDENGHSIVAKDVLDVSDDIFQVIE